MRVRDRVGLAIGGAALAVAVLVIGSALRWTQSIVAGLVALALASQLLSRRRLDRISPLVVLIGVAIVLTVVQLIPLPEDVVATLDPTGAGLRADGAALTGTHPYSCLSLDPAGTIRQVCFLVTLLGAALLSLRFAAAERGRFFVLAGVALTCGLAAAVTGAHALVNADSLYGAYDPVHATPPVLGPLLNANHLGSLMAFGAVLSIGLAFYERQASQLRVLWVVNSVGCTIVALASLSRGAVLALVLGTLVTGGIIVGQRLGDAASRRRGLARDLPIAIVVLVGIALAVFTSAGNVADQIDNTELNELETPLSKYEAWRSATTLVEEAPWTGIGRGAFEPTFTRVHPASAYVTFSHPENEYVQAVVEWGIPGALLLGLLLLRCAIVAIRRWRDGPLVAAALGATAAVLFQSSVDFGVELLGLALPVTIVAATLIVVPLRETSRPLRMVPLRLVMVGLLAAAAFVLTRSSTRSLQEDNDALVDEKEPTIDHLREVIERHPLGYFGYGQYAIAMSNINDPRSITLLNHGMRLHPTHPGLHRLAGRYLVGNHLHPQAAVEFSLALEGTLIPKQMIQEVVTLLPDADEAALAIPVDYRDHEVILRALFELNRLDVSEKYLGHLAETAQHDTRIYDELYDLATQRKDYPAAERAATLRLQLAHTELSRLMLARAEFAQNKFEPILKDLADVATWHTRIDEQGDAWLLMCDVYIQQNDLPRASSCLDQLDGKGVLGPRRVMIVERLRDIRDRQETEVKAKALQALEHSANLPDIPIVHSAEPTPVKPTNFPNPLLRQPAAPKK